MHYYTRTAARLGLATIILLSLGTAHSAHAGDIITFDNLPNEQGRTSVKLFSVANGGSSTFDGVTFSNNSYVLGDQME